LEVEASRFDRRTKPFGNRVAATAPTKAMSEVTRVLNREALEKFAALDPRKAELVKLGYFVGMNFDEAAAALGIAVPTAKQWWAYAPRLAHGRVARWGAADFALRSAESIPLNR
jgi:DNA-directed RNA polymerase specialized sigma24 family protein